MITDIDIYRGLKENYDPAVHVGFYITTDSNELLVSDQALELGISLGQAITGWEINDGVLTLKFNTGASVDVTFPEATETTKGLLSPSDKVKLATLQSNLNSKVDKITGKSLIADSEIEKLAGLPNSTDLTNSIGSAKAAGDNAQSDLNSHKQNTSNPHEVTKTQIGLGNVTNDAQVKRTEMGVAGGVATLDADGKVPSTQLPSYVDDIVDVYATYQKSTTGVLSNIVLYSDAAKTKVVTGETGKIYQNIEDGEPGYLFRWTGSVFSQTGASSLIVGEVAGTAFDGARGKAVETGLSNHKNDKDNPHEVTKAQIGLGNVENTADADKPVSTAQAIAIADAKKAGTDAQSAVEAEVTARDAAIKALDATVTSTDGTNVLVKVTEVDGKITVVNITKDETAKATDLTAEITRATAAEANAKKAGTDAQADIDEHLNNNTSGLNHVPAGGREGQVLAWESEGQAKWANTLDVFAGLEDLLSYGVEWDVTVSNPVCTRIGNPLLHKSLPVQSAYKGCIAQGDQVIYWLDPDDWSKKENGEDSILDGTDGTVRVRTPKFYGKSEEDGDKRRVRISMIKIDDTWTEIPEMLVDAYRSTVLNTVPAEGYLSTLPVNSAISVVNTTANCRGGNNRTANDTYLNTDPYRSDLGKPRTNAGRPTMRTWARNAGSEMLSYEQYKWIFYWAYVIEYANFNCQATFNENLTADGYRQGGLGDGVTTWNDTDWSRYNGYYPLTPCGYGNDMGNNTGIKAITIPATTINDTTTVAAKTFQMPRWRGFDNPFGDIWTNLDGIIIDADANNHPDNMNYVYTTNNPEKYGDSRADIANMRLAGLEVHTDGYTKLFDLGTTGEIIPKVMGGSTTTYKCDYHWTGSKETTLRTLLIGGRAHSGGYAGFGNFDSGGGVAGAYATVGLRTVNVL